MTAPDTAASRSATVRLDGTARSLIVFSHPNHELAIFGLIKRLQPAILYITDGGGGPRVAETRRGLESIAAGRHSQFLNHSETSCYRALLRRDTRFYTSVSSEIRIAVEALRVEQVFCDAVEFYNPVHDMSLPLVLHALAGRPQVAVSVVPLVYQRPSGAQAYEVQRLPDSEALDQLTVRLSEEELAAKLYARDEIYHQLRQQLGALLDVPTEHAGIEVVRPWSGPLPLPTTRALRYERRGHMLQERGEVQEVITYTDHYRAVTAQLGVG